MTLRTRLLLAFSAVVLIPIALLAFGLRQEMTRRLTEEYQRRVDAVVDVIKEDLDRESAGVADRLSSLEAALLNDNRFRAAAVAGDEVQRGYLLDYAGTAIRLTGLAMLQIQDADDRIISSGHFRNEHGRVDAGLAVALQNAKGPALLIARGADREFLALARAEPFTIAGRTFTLIGGAAVDDVFLRRLARDPTIHVALFHATAVRVTVTPLEPVLDSPATQSQAVGELKIPLIRTGSRPPAEIREARLLVTQPLTPLTTLVRSTDWWLFAAALGTGTAALLLAIWVSSRISKPLSALAEKTAVLDLDRLDVEFDPGADEVGHLSRLLGDLAARLRTSTARVREAERRATVGELARQVNHDIKNGLIPLRNVMRHLAEVERDRPAALPGVFAERRGTIDSSIAYLETLATSYQRLSPPLNPRECDLSALITEVVRAADGEEHVEFSTQLAHLPRVIGDPVAFRRILENLLANALDSLPARCGRITVSAQLLPRDGASALVRLTVADSGAGMTREQAARIFDDFYTTKAGGTGLGLSIVRRLVMDLNGTISVETAPGAGTRFIIDFPGGPTRL